MTVPDLAPHYSRFRVAERLLLTGHSHQAWPDVAFEAQQQAWLDAAELVDRKWERAAAVADEVRAGFRRLLNDADGDIALGQNTHELVVRWLSAVLPLFGRGSRTRRPSVLTTDGEFHTIRRQLDRLAEAGVDVEKIAADPVDTLAERMAARVGRATSAVLVSSVLFETAAIVPHLELLAAHCAAHEVPLLVDAYHHLNVVPFDLHALGLGRAFVVGGGYKYCQLGEGNCFLRLPPDCQLRPVITGWFSEFAELAAGRRDEVRYGAGAARFAGATYDPTSHYRAAAVFRFHLEQGLTPDVLRRINQEQVAIICDGVRTLGLDPQRAALIEMPDDARGGFVALRVPDAPAVAAALGDRGLFVDARGEILRLGPAPYLDESQVRDAVRILGETLMRQRVRQL
jgi:selenocysteine lyase/cysteine desulfurase